MQWSEGATARARLEVAAARMLLALPVTRGIPVQRPAGSRHLCILRSPPTHQFFAASPLLLAVGTFSVRHLGSLAKMCGMSSQAPGSSHAGKVVAPPGCEHPASRGSSLLVTTSMAQGRLPCLITQEGSR